MTRVITLSIILGICCAERARAGGCGVDPAVARQVIIQFNGFGTIDTFWPIIQQHFPGTELYGRIDSRGMCLLLLPPGQSGIAAADLLDEQYAEGGGNDPGPQHPLRFAEANYEGQACEGHTGTIYDSRPASSRASFEQQYMIARLNVGPAQLRSSGRGIMVAVLDTGVDGTHPVLAGRVLSTGWNFSGDGPPNVTADVGNGINDDPVNDADVDEMTGHGTFVAGLIALIAPDATILPVRVLNSDGMGDLWTVAAGMFHAIDAGADVINASLGSDYSSEAFESAVTEAYMRGIVVVAAAGNRNTNCPEFPASAAAEILDVIYPGSISVATVSDTDVRWPLSNYNTSVFLSAPGTSAETTPGSGVYDPNRSIWGPLPGEGYGIWEGSSMSTAIVSGGVALIRSQQPDWRDSQSAVTGIRARLQATSININPLNPGFAGQLGVGRIDIGAAAAAGPVQPIMGDIDLDGHVALPDLAFMLIDFGRVQSPCDLNGNGSVDLADLAHLLINFGR